MTKEEIAMQLTIQAMQSKLIDHAKDEANVSANAVVSSKNNKTAEMIASFYNTVLKTITSE